MNLSMDKLTFVGIRAAGSRFNNTQFGGTYYPAHTKNGKTVSARWEGNFFINRRGYTDSTTGQKVEGSSEIIRIVVWNGKNAAPGKGMADIFAKCVSVGKEISCDAKIHAFMKRLFIAGQPVTDAQGNAYEYPAINFRIDGEVLFGDDADSVVQAEIAAFTGAICFGARPAFWNVQGHADNAQWKTIVAQRMASTFNGTNASYGYARVLIPEGAQLVMHNPAAAGTAAGNPATGAQPTQAAAELNGGTAAAANAAQVLPV
jgi:hypothetical protein